MQGGPKHLQADVLELTPLRETCGPITNSGAFECTQNTCRQTFWTRVSRSGVKHALAYRVCPVVLKTSAGTRVGSASYFGVKHCLAYRVCPDVLRTCAGTRSEHLSYFGVKHVVAYRVCTEVLKTCAGTRHEQFSYLGVKHFIAYHA